MRCEQLNAITSKGIAVGKRVPILDEPIPVDAEVETKAKLAASCFTESPVPTVAELASTEGRALE